MLPVIEPLLPTGPLSERVLLEVTYELFVASQDANTTSVGFIYAELAYDPSRDVKKFQPPQDFGLVFPSPPPLIPLAAEAYDPVLMPLGGANFPTWTKTSTGVLNVNTYANDDDNPGTLWGVGAVQVIGSLIGATATVTHHLHWTLAATGSELDRPLIGSNPWGP
jgi:hypothetical protein